MADMDPAATPAQGVQLDAIGPSQEKDAANDSNTTPTVQEPEIQYPSGIVLALIISGLLLSMFLVALDMVSSHSSYVWHGYEERAGRRLRKQSATEHHCYGYSTHHIRV